MMLTHQIAWLADKPFGVVKAFVSSYEASLRRNGASIERLDNAAKLGRLTADAEWVSLYGSGKYVKDGKYYVPAEEAEPTQAERQDEMPDSFKEVPPGLFAFWSYDQFPYLVGGDVTHMDDRGHVQTAQYGRQYRPKPVRILPAEAGKKILEELEALKAERKAALDELNATFDKKLEAVFGSPIVK